MTIATYREEFAAFARNGGGGGPAWLPSLRQESFERFLAQGFPTTRDEDWHYTSVAPIAEASFRLPHGAARPDPSALAPFVVDDAWNRLVFVNGRYAHELSAFTELPVEVEVSTLPQAIEADPAFIQAHFATLARPDQAPFTALNTAFATDGVVVRVPDGCVVEQPIHVLWLSDGNAAGTVAFPRLLVVAGRNSRVAVVESYAGTAPVSYFTNAVSELRVGDGARVEHYRVQRESPDAYHVGTVQAVQQRDSIFHSFSFAAGARLSRANVYTMLAAPGAEGRLNGLYLLDDHQHCDHQTYVHHAAENTTSRELYKGILDDESHGVFNGKVLVDPVAQKTDGKQTNHTLLLSERAKVDTKPQLEIFADDVRCTHGATVGRIDENMMFYLKSRGVNREMARALLTYAFAAEALETIEVDALRVSLEALAFERYNEAPMA